MSIILCDKNEFLRNQGDDSDVKISFLGVFDASAGAWSGNSASTNPIGYRRRGMANKRGKGVIFVENYQLRITENLLQ